MQKFTIYHHTPQIVFLTKHFGNGSCQGDGESQFLVWDIFYGVLKSIMVLMVSHHHKNPEIINAIFSRAGSPRRKLFLHI